MKGDGGLRRVPWCFLFVGVVGDFNGEQVLADVPVAVGVEVIAVEVAVLLAALGDLRRCELHGLGGRCRPSARDRW
jgi:hypothetical protein